MLFLTSLSALALAASHHEPKSLENELVGVFSNEEQTYFEKDAGRKAPPWTSLKIDNSDGKITITEVDAFGVAIGEAQPVTVTSGKKRDNLTVGNCSRFLDHTTDGWTYSKVQNRMRCRQPWQIIAVTPDRLTLRFADGTETVLKQARTVECWAAVAKTAKKEDGSTDYLFVQKLDLHDQGGRVSVGGGDNGTEELILRMRAVHWPPPSTNRPSMVLYVHKPDAPDRAVSYSWADINASRVGINLRWMQASCTIKGAERASEITPANFRG